MISRNSIKKDIRRDLTIEEKIFRFCAITEGYLRQAILVFLRHTLIRSQSSFTKS